MKGLLQTLLLLIPLALCFKTPVEAIAKPSYPSNSPINVPVFDPDDMGDYLAISENYESKPAPRKPASQYKKNTVRTPAKPLSKQLPKAKPASKPLSKPASRPTAKPVSRAPATKTLQRPVVKPAANTIQKVSAPSSMRSGYSPQMTAKKPVATSNINPAARTATPPSKMVSATPAPATKLVLRNPSNFKGTVIKTLYSKPAYIESKGAQNFIAQTNRKPIIVIDAGHGGKDPGAKGRLGTWEKNITLKYSLALKQALERTGRYKVVLTRANDRFIELRDRVTIARRANGDVFISLHADSHPNKNTKGFSVYTLSDSRADYEARKLLARAGKEEVIHGANLRNESRDVQEAIIDFAQGSTLKGSNEFAQTVARNLGKKIQPLRRTHREGSLAVLTGADIPSVLIELGYLSNEQEERLLKRDDHKNKVVTSIATAINEYFSKFNLPN